MVSNRRWLFWSGTTAALILSAFLLGAAPPTAQLDPASAPAADGTASAPNAADTLFLNNLRSQLEAIQSTQAQLFWFNWVYGQKVNIAHTYVGREKLYSARTLSRVGAILAKIKDPRRRKAVKHLWAFLARELISRRIAPLQDQINNALVSATIVVDGKRYPYHRHRMMLANEADYDRRRRIQAACLPVLGRLNKLLLQKEKATRALAGELGFGSYIKFSEQARQFQLANLVASSMKFLDDTDAIHRKAVEHLARKHLNLGPDKFRRADVLRLFKLPKFERFFGKAANVPAVKSTLAGLGINFDKQRSITLNAAALPRKNPRAVCIPVSVPDDIRISIRPLGGWRDWKALLHEVGQAEFFAHSQATRFEFRHLGSVALPETYAFLFDGLIGNEQWVAARTSLRGQKLKDYTTFAAFAKLFIVRRYSAKLIYEYLWHSGHQDPKGLYRQLLSRAYGFPLSEGDARRYLIDHDDYFYSADYVRAWFLEAQLSEYLVKQFGKNWWDSKKAGAFLKGVWARGQEMSPDEMARTLGQPGIRSGALMRRLSAVLSGSGATAGPKAGPGAKQPKAAAKPKAAAPTVPATPTRPKPAKVVPKKK